MKNIFLIILSSHLSFVFCQTQEVPAFVTKVYEDLYKNLSSTKEITKPILQYFPNNKELIVEYIQASGGLNGKIIVGSEFVELIRSFGPDSSNALAFVLGHEMVHIFDQNLNDLANVGSAYADKDFKKKNRKDIDSIFKPYFEIQADEKSMFYSHLAGYKTTHIAEDVLTQIYRHFKLKPNLQGYPKLDERKKIARISAIKMSALLERFEIANLSLIKGSYNLSSKLYEAIINEGFKSSEMYNNLGLCYLLKVVESDTLFQKYEWPIFLDSKTKLSSGAQRDLVLFDISLNLNQAIKYFEFAKLNTDDKSAFLNLSIAHLVYDLSKEDINNDHLTDCKYSLSKIKALNLPQFITMSGIISHYEGDLEKAKSHFISNAETFPLSKRNLDKLFFNIEPIPFIYNPLNKIMDNNQNLFEVFYNKIGLISDTTTKLLNSFKNTSLVKKSGEGIEYIKFENKSIPAKIYIAEFNNQFDALTEIQLSSFSDQIFQSNLFTYYVYQDWVVRYDLYKSRKVYLIQ
jgi:hypothetical protein